MSKSSADTFGGEASVRYAQPRSIDEIIAESQQREKSRKEAESREKIAVVKGSVRDDLEFLLDDPQESVLAFTQRCWDVVPFAPTEAETEALIGGFEELDARIRRREGKFVFASTELAAAYQVVLRGFIQRLKESPPKTPETTGEGGIEKPKNTPPGTAETMSEDCEGGIES